MQLPDINLWLALAFEVHVHHRQASAWFGSLPSAGAAFCRFTQQGFLRLATNPSVFQDEAVTLADVIKGVNFIFNKPGGPWDAAPSGACCL